MVSKTWWLLCCMCCSSVLDMRMAIRLEPARDIIARGVDPRFGALTFSCYRDDTPTQKLGPPHTSFASARVKSKPRFISSAIHQFLPRINLPTTKPFAQFSHLSALSCCYCCSTSSSPVICIHNRHNAYSQPRKGAGVAVVIAADGQHRETHKP